MGDRDYKYNVQGSLEFKGKFGAKAYDIEYILDQAVKRLGADITVLIDLTTNGRVVVTTTNKNKTTLLSALDYAGLDVVDSDESSYANVKLFDASIRIDAESFSKFVTVATQKFGNFRLLSKNKTI